MLVNRIDDQIVFTDARTNGTRPVVGQLQVQQIPCGAACMTTLN